MGGDRIMEDATETVVNHSDLGSRQLPEATVVHGCENKPENVIVDESVSLEQIERSILQCDRRIAEYVVQITQLNLTDPVRAEELRQLHDVQFKDRRCFTLARDLITKSRDGLSWLSTKVPENLPRIQWINHVFDHSAEVFSNIADALRKFKDVLLMHGLNPGYRWRRLIPGSLRPDHRGWLEELPRKGMSWKSFGEEFQSTFGNDQEDERLQAFNELLEIKMGSNEHLDQYIDRFMQLKRRATEMNGVMLSSRFVKGLIPSLGQLVNMAISGWSRSRRSSISRVIRITRRMVLHLPVY